MKSQRCEKTLHEEKDTFTQDSRQPSKSFHCECEHSFFAFVVQYLKNSHHNERRQYYLQKIKFETDYQEGASPEVLSLLMSTNLEQTSGYGEDPHTFRAKELIRKEVGKPDSAVYFMAGGTQTNTTVIKHLLSPCEGVIAVSTGHINVHESGAIESTGHKVIALEGHDGLLDAEDLCAYMEAFNADPTNEHMVQPGMVYVSYSSELGTLYTKQGLSDIKRVCEDYGLKLFVDGARIGTAVTSEASDMSMKDIAGLCDAFYIGGTKNGALLGEAVVFPNPENVNLRQFTTLIKQQGGLLAKGRLLGIQFEALFENGLFYRNAKHANSQAMKIKRAFTEKGIPFLIDSPTNQQFPILTRQQNEALSQKFSYESWQPLKDGRLAVRFCTSWATTDDNINELIEAIRRL
ncbi:MAG: low specificity L-threonine aldolase [Synergistaceae bacterium]|nr:low specificity L-threonine aldolase [Synergistaceae bacterium]